MCWVFVYTHPSQYAPLHNNMILHIYRGIYVYIFFNSSYVNMYICMYCVCTFIKKKFMPKYMERNLFYIDTYLHIYVCLHALRKVFSAWDGQVFDVCIKCIGFTLTYQQEPLFYFEEHFEAASLKNVSLTSSSF